MSVAPRYPTKTVCLKYTGCIAGGGSNAGDDQVLFTEVKKFLEEK